MLTTAVKSFKRFPFTWLFVSLLLTIGVHPILQNLGINILGMFLAVNLVAVIFSLRQLKEVKILVWLAIGFIVLRAAHLFLNFETLLEIGDILWVVTCVLAGTATLQFVLAKGKITQERLFAALDLYLLAGIAFGVSYTVLEQYIPNSFSMAGGGKFTLEHGIYFSFVTLATLGYGDVVPVDPAARGLAILEAVGAQIYLAVLIARLVSSYSRE